MSQVITNAFEQYWQSSLAAEQPVVLDEFILADIPNLDITAPIDPDTVLPPESQIVHRQSVDQRGRINNNAVAYSIVMDTTVGDFSFNAMFLRNKANGVIGMIVYKGRETKLKTDQTTGQTGNSLVKSMLMGYDQAAEATLTNVDAGTWQIDYAARLRGQDEDLRQLASQLYGHHTFIGDGFKVVQQAGGHQVTPGVAIVGGLRVELNAPEVIYPGSKPIGVWVDVHRAGSLLSEHQNHFTIITSVAELADHVDSYGYQHYVAKLGTILADSTIEDGRGSAGGGSSGAGSIPDTFALWRRSMAEAGYDLIGQFGTKMTIESANQVVLSKDGSDVFLWEGELPKSVLAEDSPESQSDPVNGVWVNVTSNYLKNNISDEVVKTSRTPSATGIKFPNTLHFYIQSSPINLLEALPTSYVKDGSVDYSIYVQKVCDYLKEYGGGKIIVPHNMRILIGNINSYANVEWFGYDWSSELLVKPEHYGISVNFGDGGTPDPDDNARNCVFHGFRIRGQVEGHGFSQHKHLLNLNAVSALSVLDMSLVGAQGDFIYLGSSNLAGVERHNEDVTIEGVHVDGVNKNQRNGISVVDCNGLVIRRSRFKRVSRSDMPGAIDIEPNNYDFSIVKNITVEDIYINDIDGYAGVGAYVPPLPAEVEGNAHNIRFNRIHVENAPNATVAGIVVRRDVPRQSPSHGCSLTQITGKNISRPFSIEGVTDGVIFDCSFENARNDALVGNSYKPVRDLKIEKLSMTRCGTSALGALKISKAFGLEIEDSKFVDCGEQVTGGDIRFGAGESERVRLITNIHDNPGGGNSRVTSADAAHVFNPNTNQCIGNSYLGSKIYSSFPAFRTDETNGVQNVFTAITPPNEFPQGTSTALWNSPAGTLPVGYTQGICVTENVLSSIGMAQVITQTFTPRGNGSQLETFYRYGSNDGLSWGAWRKISAI